MLLQLGHKNVAYDMYDEIDVSSPGISIQHQACNALLLVVSYFLILTFYPYYCSIEHVLLQCFSDAGGVLFKIASAHSLLTMKVQEYSIGGSLI